MFALYLNAFLLMIQNMEMKINNFVCVNNLICLLDTPAIRGESEVSDSELDTYNAAGASRQHVQNVSNVVKNVNILEFGDYIWNHHGKCIQISTNMTGIGSSICEIDVNISEISERKTFFAQ